MRLQSYVRILVPLLILVWTAWYWHEVFARPEMMIGMFRHPERVSNGQMTYLVTFGAIWTAAMIFQLVRGVRALCRTPVAGNTEQGSPE